MIKVLIADDTQFMRANLKLMFERNSIEVVGEADSGTKVVSMYKTLRPDVVTMDITMPNVNGIEATKKIIALDPSAKIIIISSLGQGEFVREAIKAGAKNFLVKPYDEEKLIKVVHKVMGL